MKFIIKQFIDLCLFKLSPADMPISKVLLQLTLLFYFCIGTTIGLLKDGITISVLSSLADTGVMVLITMLLLHARGFAERITQTLIALAGAGGVFGIISYPIISYFYSSMINDMPSVLGMSLMLIMMFWSLMVTAHIFRFALEIKPSLAAFLTVVYTFLSMIVVGLIISGVA